MNRERITAFSIMIILLGASACSPQVSGPVLGNAVDTAIAQTKDVQTSVANAVASTMAAMVTNTPEFTFTPSLTPTPTFTLTPAYPLVSVSVDTNCRTGPGNAYDMIGGLAVGQTAEVIGRDAASQFWLIHNPSNPSVICWLWGKYATVTGNTSGLPIATPPPTPTPKATPTPWASFKLVYASTLHCGTSYYLKFKITNNGTVTWQSNKVMITDQVTHQVRDVAYDYFDNLVSCTQSEEADNLKAGEVGMTRSDNLASNPAGHSILATIGLCSDYNLTGTCLDKTITFTP